jgi:hypothetical protein
MKTYPKYLDWVRYACAYLLLTYGFSKLAGVQFTLPTGIAKEPVGSLSGHDLTWYYYSYSPAYASILGLVQLAGGTMLLFRRTALLAALLMLPVVANIMMINVFFHIRVGAECMAAFLLGLLLVLLARDRNGFVTLFWANQASEEPQVRNLHWKTRTALVVIAALQIILGVFYARRR